MTQVIHTTANLDVDNVFTGVNTFSQSLLLTESACQSGAAATVILCDDPTSHRFKFNPNNTGALIAVGISAAGTATHCPQFAANGIDLVDSGAGCGSASTLTLKTNNVNNGSQSLLNLTQGSGITLTDNGVGQVTVAATGSGGTVTGTGTTSTLPIWSNGPAGILGDSNLRAITGPNGLQYTTGVSQYIQIDTSNLLWNTGVAGSGNILIQNIFAPGSNNNSGGVKIAGAPSTGSSCAGAVTLAGGGTNGDSNGSTVVAGGGCSNGFGATGSDVTITAGSTTHNNGGGRVILVAGTGNFANGSVNVAGRLNLTASTTASSGLNTGVGTAPTSPVNGDLWSTASGVFARVNGVTVALAGSGAVTSVFGRTGAVVATTGDYTAAQVTNAVSTAAANTGAAAMTLNMAASTSAASFRLPNIAGASSTTVGALSYDLTNKNIHAGANGVDTLIGLLPSSIAPVNNDCVKWTVAAGVVTLNTAGTPCGTSSGVTGSGTTNTIPVFTGTSVVGNSLLTDDGTTLNYTGTGGLTLTSTIAGYAGLGQGTAQGLSTNAIGLTAPSSVTAYNLIFPGAANNGYMKWSNSSNFVTGSFHSVVDTVGSNLDLTGQSASLGSQTLVASAPATGRYNINYYVSESAGCATPGPGVVTATFSWTDATVARSLVSSTLTFTTAPGAGDTIRGTIPVWAASASAITAITTYTACTTGTATYDIHAWVTEAQ